MRNTATFYKFLKFLKPYWVKGIFAFLLMLFSIVLQLPMPFLTKYLIDKVIISKNFHLLNIIGLILIGILLIRSASVFLKNYLLTIFRGRVIFDIRVILFEHLQKLSLSFFHKNNTGYLMSRVSSDVDEVHGLLANTLVSFGQNILTFLTGIAATIYIHPKLALICFLILPLYLLSLWIFNKRIREISHEVRESYANVQKDLQELLSGIFTIKAFNREKCSTIKLVKSLKDSIKKDIKLDILTTFANISSVIISSFGPLALIWYGCSEIMKGNLTVGGLLAFSSFTRYLFGPTQALFNINVEIQRSLAACERIFEILDIKTEKEGKKELKIEKGEIIFDNVSFSYNGAKQVLKEISFKANFGEVIALVGRSGVGKTTLLNLLPRFYNPQEGKILIDGEDIKEIKLDSLRKNIGIVAQETFLYSDSIIENIKFGKINALESEIFQAIQLSGVDEFVKNLPEGYKTKVGERGINLSGGQRQRIAIARAILRNPKILIFDEATSNLDSQTEKLIQKALEPLFKNRTTFIIAHRLSTVLNSDKILVLDNGRLIAQGTHNELYKTCDIYRILYKEQFENKETNK